MSKILFGLSVLSFLLGGLCLAVAKSAFHEQIAVGFFICFALFFSSSAIVAEISEIREFLKEQAELKLITSVHDLNPRERRA